MRAEGFRYGEDDASAAYGEAFDIVELAVAVQVVVGVQTVQLHGAEQGSVLQFLLGDVGEVNARAVTLVFDVKAELLAAHAACAQVVDVFHHQFPAGRLGASGCTLEQFYEQRVGVAAQVGGEFSHLIGGSAIGVFIGNGQYVVGL